MKVLDYLNKYRLLEISTAETIFSPNDINPILEKYFIQKGWDKVANIGIEYLVGICQETQSKSLVELLKVYYQDGESYDYFSRANGPLDYSPDEIRTILDKGLQNGSINVKELEKKRYLINSNGIHRFLMLKLAYLYEQQQGVEDIQQKFSIPATIIKCDFIKSYCYFLLARYSGVDIDRMYNQESQNLETVMSGKINPSTQEMINSVMTNVEMNNRDFIYLMKKVPSLCGFMQILNPSLRERCDKLEISEKELNDKVSSILESKREKLNESSGLPDYIDAFSFFGNPYDALQGKRGIKW